MRLMVGMAFSDDSEGDGMRWMVVAALAAVIAGNTAASARDCGDEATQAGMNKCVAERLKTADTALNKTYQQIVHRLGDDADTLKLLRDAQRWVVRLKLVIPKSPDYQDEYEINVLPEVAPMR